MAAMIPIEPPDPPDFPPPNALPGLGTMLVPRYTCNLVVNEETKLIELLHDVIFVSSRHFLSQNYNGRVKLGTKKEVDWGLTVDVINAGEAFVELDDVSSWQADTSKLLLVDPYTEQSEIRKVTGAHYLIGGNDVEMSQDSDPAGDIFTLTDFAGADGDATPATGTLEVSSPPVDGTTYTWTLDGVEISFIATSSDTEITVGSFLTAVVLGHPELRRRFRAEFDGVDTITLTALFGSLDVDEAFEFSHAAPVANPTAAPTLTSPAASTDLLAGAYRIAYAYRNSRGQTLLSPYKEETILAGDKIVRASVTPPAGCTVVTYVSVAAGSNKLRFHSENNGAAVDILTLPKLTASYPPDVNRTGAECMRICASFSDRELKRSRRLGSNVIRGTFKWFLGNREKGYNRVDLKFRDAADDWRAVELRLRDDAHIAKTKKTSNIEINGQAIDNFFQAYRICASLLAEYRDADFFYQFDSSKKDNGIDQDVTMMLLEEGDVVCVTDDGSGVINLPVRLEDLLVDPRDAGLPSFGFTARKFYNELYDDSPNDVTKTIVVEEAA